MELKMFHKVIWLALVVLTLQTIGAAPVMCPNNPNCFCGGTIAVELSCNIDGHAVKINLLPNIYINIKCENATSLDYSKIPKFENTTNTFKSVSFKDCPIPSSSFKDILTNMGVAKTMALIFQNAKNLSDYFDRKHFAGLQDLTKLLLSVNGITHLPDNLFMDINKLTWLNIRTNSINLSEELFKPLERLEILEISHNHMTNISSNLFSHLSYLRKLSLWQSNVTWFSKDLFSGVDVLEELDLSSNGLNELPSSIFKPLKKLKKLTLFSNKFSSLPQNLFKNNEELETVVILNNDVKLKELPKYLFGCLPNLKEIYIQRSGLEDIPYDVFVNSPLITNISLAHNDIKTLPEPIFNDQIYLLELDLSYNKIEELKPKLFSSLVRLEKLNLCHNSIVEISGVTFSSLLSLIYLDMEHNNLTTISSYLFCNNRQRMSISLAYNKLDFEYKMLTNNSSKLNRWSPFARTYNLKLLNLSHNEFNGAFGDWLLNGHENLDISHNNISNIWFSGPPYGRNMVKQIWMSGNPMQDCCICWYVGINGVCWHKWQYPILEFLKRNVDIKIVDIEQLNCPLEECPIFKYLYYIRMFLIWMVMLGVGLLLRYKTIDCVFYSAEVVHKWKAQWQKKIIMKYSDKDEEFVLKEVLPILRCYKCLKFYVGPIKKTSEEKNCLSIFTSCFKAKYTTVVVFSSNYLTSTYSHVDIKKIHSEMLKAEDTIYMFVDIDPENSIYAFLEEQRDIRTSVLWNEANFGEKFLAVLTADHDEAIYNKSYQDPRNIVLSAEAKLPSNITFSELPELPNLYDVSKLTHNQV